MNKALLVVDMQNDLCRDPRRREAVESMLPKLRDAIDLFNRAGGLVVYPYFALDETDEQFSRFGDVYCVAGTAGADIINELKPLKGPAIAKRKHSAFFDTDLDELLKAAGIRELYLAGLQTHICILTTAADASFRGYKPIALADCTLSSQPAKHEEGLAWIKQYVGDVKSFAELKGELRRD